MLKHQIVMALREIQGNYMPCIESAMREHFDEDMESLIQNLNRPGFVMDSDIQDSEKVAGPFSEALELLTGLIERDESIKEADQRVLVWLKGLFIEENERALERMAQDMGAS